MMNASAVTIARRTAVALAWFGLALCVIASTILLRLVRSSDVSAGVSAVGNGLYYFLALPLAFSIAGTAASHRNSIGPMWAAIGGLFGCVLVGALSVGRFFAPAALALLVAGAAHLVAARPRWCALIIPLWIAVGLFAIPVVFLGAAVMQRLIGGGVIFPGETREFDTGSIRSIPSFAFFGSWLFLGAVAALAAVDLARRAWSRRAEHPLLAPLGLVIVLVAIALIESLAIGRSVKGMQRGHAMGCESSGNKTTCWSQ